MSLLSQPNETKQFKPRPNLADYFAQTAKIEIERRNQKKRPLARAFFISREDRPSRKVLKTLETT
jgi:hypothetical protein